MHSSHLFHSNLLFHYFLNSGSIFLARSIFLACNLLFPVIALADEAEEETIIVVNLSGRGDKDLAHVINILGDDL